jgi:hypothetical protein
MGCGTDETTDEESTTLADNSSASATQVATNIDTVKSNMLPGSLAISSTSSLALQDDDPCADSDGFIDCQPNLLKLYLAIGKQMVGMTGQMIANSASFINSQEIGSSGSLETGETEVSKVEYNIPSASEYSLMLHSTNGAFMYLSVDQSGDNPVYQIKFDGSAAPDEDDGGPAQVSATITYTSDTEFIVDMEMGGSACDPNDVRAPQNIAIYINRNATQWKGKANLYSPRWLGENLSCDTEPSASTSLYMYHDFVGNETNTTASLYLASSDLTDKTAYGDWGIEDLCTNFSNVCGPGGTGMGENVVIADTYINPFCVTGQDSVWNSACDDAPVTDYSSQDLWVLPADLKVLSPELPESL